MEFLVGQTFRAAEVEMLAKRHVFYDLLREEMDWRPALTSRQVIRGAGVFYAAKQQRRGAILNFTHHPSLPSSGETVLLGELLNL